MDHTGHARTSRSPAASPLPPRRVPPRPARSPAEAWEVRLLHRLLRAIDHAPIAFRLPDGREVAGSGTPVSCVVLRDRGALLRLVADPELQFGELYGTGRLEIEGDLVRLLVVLGDALRRTGERGNQVRRLADRLRRARRNTLDRARRNIHHHYDIGNDFYRLWLDEELVYTCAYFPSKGMTLEEAQRAKHEHVCRKAEIRPGLRVVEAGCGWGALALYMARERGVTVEAYNISSAQIAWARERARREGLDDRVRFVEDDWRNVRGTFDRFVSVGMLEHVGVGNYPLLGEVIDRSLARGGRAFVHTIGRNVARPLNAWIDRRIFPGAQPPSLREMMGIFEGRFSVLDVENLRLHYAETLRHWLERYERNVDRVRAMFDESFVRTWRLYLSGSIAAFEVGDLQLFQVVAAREDDNDLPRTRAHLYGSSDR